MIQFELIDADRREAEKFRKTNPRSIEPLKGRVLTAYDDARRAAHDPRGWGRGVEFVQHVLYPAHRTFRFRTMTGNTAERVAWCFAAIRFFESCAAMPLNHLESAGYIARQEEPRNAAPVTNFGFDAGGFVRRLASQGIVISLTPDRQIAIRGPVDPSAKNQIIGHKAEIVGYLEAPAEVIA